MNLDLFVRDLNESAPESLPLGASVSEWCGSKAYHPARRGSGERDGGGPTRLLQVSAS